MLQATCIPLFFKKQSFVRALALDVEWFHCTVLLCILPFAHVVILASECPGSIILYRKYP